MNANEPAEAGRRLPYAVARPAHVPARFAIRTFAEVRP